MSTSDVSDADSDDIAGLLGDADALDDDLFGGALNRKKPPTETKQKPPTKKAVSFAPEKRADQRTPSPVADSMAKSDGLNDLFGPTSFARKPAAPAQSAPKQGTSPMDSLFGPTARRPAAKETKPATSWLGIGGKDDEQSSEEDTGFQKLISQKRRETTERVPSDTENSKRPTTAAPASKPPEDRMSTLPFLQKSEPQQVPAPRAAPASAPVASHAPAPSYQTRAPQHVDDDALRRLKEENERLSSALSEQRQKSQAAEQKLEQEWRDKLAAAQRETELQTDRLKQLHKQALDQMNEDQQMAIDRVKSTMTQELEAAASAYEHTKSYHEVVTKIEGAVEQLSGLSGNLTDLQDKTSREREVTLEVRETRVKALEERLEAEIGDLRVEREKVHSILFTLESNAKEQEKFLGHERLSVQQERVKLDSEKSVFHKEQQRISETLGSSKDGLDQSREAFLKEQHELLERVLAEREFLQQERAAFNAQRDRDVIRLKREAAQLDEQRHKMQASIDEAERVKRTYEERQHKLIHIEQTLNDECAELESAKMALERERRECRLLHEELNEKKNELEELRKDATQTVEMRKNNWNLQRLDIQRQQEMLQAKELELVEKHRQMQRQRAALIEERRQAKTMASHCPNCGQANSPIHQVAEKPYDSPRHFERSGSIRTVLRQHAKELERFVQQEDTFMGSL